MKTAGRILALLLALCLCIPVQGRAAQSVSFSVERVAAADGTARVRVLMHNSPGIINLKLRVVYDAQKLSLAGYEAGDLSGLTSGPPTANPFTFSWTDAIHPDVTGDAVVATLIFNVLDGASGTAALTLSCDEDDVFNGEFDNVPFTLTNGAVIISETPPTPTPTPTPTPAEPVSFSIENVTASDGTARVRVLMKDSPGIINLKLRVAYDAQKLSLAGYEEGDLSGLSYGPSGANPFTFSWTDAIHPDVTGDAVVATLIFNVLDGASGTAALTLSCEEDDMFDGEFNNVPFTLTDGSVTIPDAPQPPTPVEPVSFSIINVTASDGTARVRVLMKDSPGIINLKLRVAYDAQKLALAGYEECDLAGLSYGPSDANPFTFSWTDAIHPDVTGDAVVATLIFNVLDGASGTAALTLSCDEDDVFDGEFDNVPFTLTDGSVTIPTAQVQIVSVSASSNTVSAVVDCFAVHGVVLCAAYTANGKLVTFDAKPIISGQNTYLFPFRADLIKVFVIDTQSRPLCTNASLLLTENGTS